ncbi:hypothetical protein QN084_23385 (plasmid) [Paenarthrobacter sp. R1]|uniref:hypothetical protein n=1 Tax=Paenarthrobacter sp. R1 TaxID=3049085 RepID=UPI002553F1A6|nr:hypothetical protein [Paenarthrobacter sp. R1]WIV33580.1 hypothetical protein QN084_23385 [Paenarthrobacter sp. R1]
MACSREGRHWSEDPEAVRAIAGTIDSIMDDTSEGPKDSPPHNWASTWTPTQGAV